MVEVSMATLTALYRRASHPRLTAVIAAIVIVASGFVVASFWLGDDNSPDNGLRAGIAATTITSFTVSPTTAYLDEPVTFIASASSTTGSTLTFTFFYDALDGDMTNNTESPRSVHTTGEPGTVETEFTYTRLGNLTLGTTSYYVVRLFVGDGSNTVSTTRSVYVIENTAPKFSDELPLTKILYPDEVAYFNTTVVDNDDDPVTVTWDFGDGTVLVNETGNAGAGVSVRQSHAWSPVLGPGMGPNLYYYMVVTLEDPYSNVATWTIVITVKLPANGLPIVYFDASSNTVDPDEDDEVTFYANAKDPEGEALTWTFVVNNSIEDVDVFVFHTDVTPVNTTIWNNLTYAFPSPGTYNVRIYVSDALIPYQIYPHNVTKVEYVYVIGNAVPSVVDQIAMSDETPSINTSIGSVTITFKIQVYDGDGDILTVVWDMAEDVPRTNVSDGGLKIFTFEQERVFNTTGRYNVSATVTDGLAGHEMITYRIFNVTSNNLPPVVIEFNFTYATGDFALPGESVQFTLTLSDPENDTLEIVWDFGDNTSLVHFNLTEYVNGITTCVVNHTYDEVGTYDLTINYTDNEQFGLLKHNKTKYGVVTVDNLRVDEADIWSWWDYTSLALVILVPVLFVLNLVRIGIKRKKLEESGGMSWTEMKLREDEMATQEESDFYREVD